MKHSALPPLHLRPNNGWERRKDGCSFTLPCIGCFQTNTAACVVRLWSISDVNTTQLLPEITFSFVWRQHFLVCGIRDWKVNTPACAHDRWRGEIDSLPRTRIVLDRKLIWLRSGAAPMASVSKVSILDYFHIVFEGENGKIESNCKACGTRIQAKRSVTSNFVTHLKVII